MIVLCLVLAAIFTTLALYLHPLYVRVMASLAAAAILLALVEMWWRQWHRLRASRPSRLSP